MTDRLGRRLLVTLEAARLQTNAHRLPALRFSLDSWPGIGRIAADMARQGFDLQFARDDERGWRATVYTSGMEHSPTSATGPGWEPTPWHATQRAAWEAIGQASDG